MRTQLHWLPALRHRGYGAAVPPRRRCGDAHSSATPTSAAETTASSSWLRRGPLTLCSTPGRLDQSLQPSSSRRQRRPSVGRRDCDVRGRLRGRPELHGSDRCSAACNERLVMSRSDSTPTRLVRSASGGLQLAGPALYSSSRAVSAAASSLLIAFALLPLPFCRLPLCSASSTSGKTLITLRTLATANTTLSQKCATVLWLTTSPQPDRLSSPSSSEFVIRHH